MIKIVPVYDPARHRAVEAAPATDTPLTFRGGVVLANVEIVSIFLGAKAKWSATVLQRTRSFLDYFVQSELIDQLTEYSISTQRIGRGRHKASIQVSKPATSSKLSDTQIRTRLHKLITDGFVPQPNANTLYVFCVPTGVTLTMDGGHNCSSFCGYHDTVNSNIFYAVVSYPDPTCTGCLGGMAAIDAFTGTLSHEICEAITDPIPGMGWYNDAKGEIGDICSWQFRSSGGYNVQKEWSNQKNACV